MNKNEIIFHIIDISSDDISIGSGDWRDKEFILTFYGKTRDNLNVVCNVKGYHPYFYIRIPDEWSEGYSRKFLKDISDYNDLLDPCNYQNGRWTNYVDEEFEINRSYNFYGYNYDNNYKKVRNYKFIRVSFNSYGDMRSCCKAIEKYYYNNIKYVKEGHIIKDYPSKKGGKVVDLENPLLKKVNNKKKAWFFQENNCACLCNMYESKVHPLLRFLHGKEIEPCGWVKVCASTSKYVEKEDKQFNVDIELDNLYMKDIVPYRNDEIAKFVIASFDIECDSSHGDFPNPCKDFRKLAIDIYESYFRTSKNYDSKNIQMKYIKKCIIDGLNGGSTDIQDIVTINGSYTDISLTEVLDKIDRTLIDKIPVSRGAPKKRDEVINKLTIILNGLENDKGEKLEVKGDPIIQIGTVFHRYGESECYNRSIVVIGNEDKEGEKVCDDITGIDIFECNSEKELLLKWKDLILYHNPDIITGYNIFGFDFDYINKRVNYLFPCVTTGNTKFRCKKTNTYTACNKKCCKNNFYRLGRLMRDRDSDIITNIYDKGVSSELKSQEYYNKYWEKKCKVVSKKLSSSGLGDNELKYISMDGRIIFDIQKEIQKGHSLDSYKLDDVSSYFMRGRIKSRGVMVDKKLGVYLTRFDTNTIGNLKEGDYITININTKYGLIRYKDGGKYKIYGLNHTDPSFAIIGYIENIEDIYKDDIISYEWCLSKDDISPQQIFDYHKEGGSSGRSKVAKYCIMDCELCIHLLLRLDLIPNNIGMANVSWVPLSYIFLRGQGVKINSIITKECSCRNTRIPTLCGFSESLDDGFEGAVVLDPTPGIYKDDPISVLDYASLYPSSIIEKNLSHETYIGTTEDIKREPDKYDELLSRVKYWKIDYDDYASELKGKTVHKYKVGTKTECYFVKEEEKRGIIPIVLQTLLDERKNTRKRIYQTNDENKKKVLDGLQLAYKITANSVYGQMGAKTSSIFFKKIAACTTSIGRQRIEDASIGVKRWAKEHGYHEPDVIYGDTDSVFVKFSRINKDTGELLNGKKALEYCIDCGVKSGKWITEHMLHKPQDLEYEKTFYPFILISKKRYTGDKYELDFDRPKERTSMGIVMKRRDNAPIVKYVFGNVIEKIMNQTIDIAIAWLKDTLGRIRDGGMSDSLFIISKSLRGYYKNPDGIAHKVLADRMAERNPGNKPKPNDRIPYIYMKIPDDKLYDYSNPYKSGPNKGKPRLKKILQGDRIEHPDYISQNGIKIDYGFYISNQIMNPVKQVLDLVKDEKDTGKIFEEYI